jgi:PmbA protein
MSYADLAGSVPGDAKRAGADAADVVVSEGNSFSVTVRRGEIETLKHAVAKALGVRVFVGRRHAVTWTSDFSPAALRSLLDEAVAMARASGDDEHAGLPDETPPAEDLDLGLFDPAIAAVPTEERIEAARLAEAAAFDSSPEITNSQGSSYASEEGEVVLANSLGFVGAYRSSAVSMSVGPVAQRNGSMERDYWYTTSRRRDGLLSPQELGRIAAERTLRRLGARQPQTAHVPVVFDPETASQLLGHLFGAINGYAVFRNSTFLQGRLGEQVASPLVTVVDEGRRPGGLGARPFDGEGSPTRRNVPIENGVLKHWLCDWYAARKIGAPPTGSARRGVAGAPSVGPGDLCLAPGDRSPQSLVAELERGLYVTDLIGFGVNLVTGDFSQGAAGLWIEKGQFTHPVNEITIAGNLGQMLLDVDAVADDLEFRGSVAAPTLRVRRMTVSGR